MDPLIDRKPRNFNKDKRKRLDLDASLARKAAAQRRIARQARANIVTDENDDDQMDDYRHLIR